jgi:hypothetical protein
VKRRTEEQDLLNVIPVLAKCYDTGIPDGASHHRDLMRSAKRDNKMIYPTYAPRPPGSNGKQVGTEKMHRPPRKGAGTPLSVLVPFRILADNQKTKS